MRHFFGLLVVVVGLTFQTLAAQATDEQLSADFTSVHEAQDILNRYQEAWFFGIGEWAINNDRNFVWVTVAGIEHGGTYVLQFQEGPLAGQYGGNWIGSSLSKARGCAADLCTGETVINIDRNYVYTIIEAIQYSGEYVLRFQEGPLAGQRGGNWDRNQLARTRGCGNNFCVGQVVRNRDRNYVLVQIAGIQFNGTYVVDFLEGQLAGQRGGNWADTSLVWTR